MDFFNNNNENNTNKKSENNTTVNIKNILVNQYLFSKSIYQDYLIYCLKIPLYKRFVDIYQGFFDSKNKTDTKVVVIFQEHMKKIQQFNPSEINQEAIEILSHSNCARYISKLIQIVIYLNNRIFLITSNSDIEFYNKELPNSLMFFKTLLTQVSDFFYRDPFIFCQDKVNGKKLNCANHALESIEICIKHTISILGFEEEIMDKFLKEIKHVDKIIFENNKNENTKQFMEKTEEKNTNKQNNDSDKHDEPDEPDEPDESNESDENEVNDEESESESESGKSSESKKWDKNEKYDEDDNAEFFINEDEEDSSEETLNLDKEEKQKKTPKKNTSPKFEKNKNILPSKLNKTAERSLPQELALITYKTKK